MFIPDSSYMLTIDQIPHACHFLSSLDRLLHHALTFLSVWLKPGIKFKLASYMASEADARAEPITFVNDDLAACGLDTETPGVWHIDFKVWGARTV
eukprot:1144988-Pelagomonas_calceolata.AAC.3